MPSLHAALFDLDGTLCNSDNLHFAAWRDELAAAPRPYVLSHEDYKGRISGKANVMIAQEFLPYLEDNQRASICSNKESRFRDLASHDGALLPLEGLLHLIASLKSSDVRIACVTNAPRVNAEFMLKQMGLSKAFEQLIIGDECSSSKPSPDPYLEAMRRLKVEPNTCVVFEDSSSGLAAARASGAALRVGLCTTHHQHALKHMGAHVAFPDYSCLSVDELRRLHSCACGDGCS
jgi:HAD superfamily hydrolase (TIGR01509 family)